MDGLVNIMKYHDNGNTKFFIQPSDQFQDLDLIPDIQVSGRLIQKKAAVLLTVWPLPGSGIFLCS